jgi:2-polyprenyl-3-methyl-5-hydroxy-6-metoxy-1,4-benzoquinol methylase
MDSAVGLRLRTLQRGALERGRRLWDRRAHSWEHHGSVGLERVVQAVVEAASPRPGMAAVDLGCGGGQLAIPLAKGGAEVIAIDISPKMIEVLDEKAAELGLDITTRVSALQSVALPTDSLDLVVSNYTMHHLKDDEKAATVRAAVSWLRPGGRIVVGDMMFGRGGASRDREIIAAKARVLLGRGWAGWWRLAKNVVRFGLRLRERPLPVAAWQQIFVSAGLVDVRAALVVAEAAIVSGEKPVPSAPLPHD